MRSNPRVSSSLPLLHPIKIKSLHHPLPKLCRHHRPPPQHLQPRSLLEWRRRRMLLVIKRLKEHPKLCVLCVNRRLWRGNEDKEFLICSISVQYKWSMLEQGASVPHASLLLRKSIWRLYLCILFNFYCHQFSIQSHFDAFRACLRVCVSEFH